MAEFQYPAWLAGMEITAARLASMLSTTAYKAADTSATSDIVLSADPDLSIAVEADAVYEIDGVLLIASASQTPDILIQMEGPASSTGVWSAIGPPTSATTDDSTMRNIATAMSSSRSYGIQSTSGTFGLHINGMLDTAGTAGNFFVSWCQSTSNATATTMKAYSWVRVKRIS